MTEQSTDRTTLENVPNPVVKKKRQFSIVWLIPLVAALIGAWLAYKTISEKGPTITITFENAEGLEAGKTKIKYKDVEIGQVESIRLSRDLSHVVLTADLVKDAEQYLTENTRFWVTRARVTASQITGLGTIFSGAYIGIEPGKEGKPVRAFKGLETPPVISTDVPGRYYMLRADRLGSIDIGVPVYYRQIKVGQVVAYDLAKDGQAVNIKIFVHAPYDGQVRENTRFWNAGGVDVSLSASGLQVNTESLVSMLLGGVAFETPVNLEPGEIAKDGHLFKLYANREQSYQKTYLEKRYFVLFFNESVRGLAPGAPVEFRGIKIGQVLDVTLEASHTTLEFRTPVLIEIEPERFSITGKQTETKEKVLEKLIERGLRAQLKTGNLLTGQLYVELGFYPNAPRRGVEYAGKYPVIPTVPTPLEAASETLAKFLDRLDKLPLEQTVTELRQGVKALNETITVTRELVSRMGEEVAPQAKATLEQAEKTLASIERLTSSDGPANQDLRQALREFTEAAHSIRILTDYLQQHPDSIIFGKGNER
jgi:paraquat-inducible protein B